MASGLVEQNNMYYKNNYNFLYDLWIIHKFLQEILEALFYNETKTCWVAWFDQICWL